MNVTLAIEDGWRVDPEIVCGRIDDRQVLHLRCNTHVGDLNIIAPTSDLDPAGVDRKGCRVQARGRCEFQDDDVGLTGPKFEGGLGEPYGRRVRYLRYGLVIRLVQPLSFSALGIICAAFRLTDWKAKAVPAGTLLSL